MSALISLLQILTMTVHGDVRALFFFFTRLSAWLLASWEGPLTCVLSLIIHVPLRWWCTNRHSTQRHSTEPKCSFRKHSAGKIKAIGTFRALGCFLCSPESLRSFWTWTMYIHTWTSHGAPERLHLYVYVLLLEAKCCSVCDCYYGNNSS